MYFTILIYFFNGQISLFSPPLSLPLSMLSPPTPLCQYKGIQDYHTLQLCYFNFFAFLNAMLLGKFLFIKYKRVSDQLYRNLVASDQFYNSQSLIRSWPSKVVGDLPPPFNWSWSYFSKIRQLQSNVHPYSL